MGLLDSTQEPTENIFRPHSFDDFVGNKGLVDKLKIAVDGAKARKDSITHVLIGGPAGTGKSSISYILARSYDQAPRVVTATAIKSIADIIDIVLQMEPNGVLFIDEIHALNKKIEEQLYPVLEDFKIDIKKDRGLKKSIVSINIPRFCIVGATTKIGSLSDPFRDRFGIIHNMDFYNDSEIVDILQKNIHKVGIKIDNTNLLGAIAVRSRGIPRVALRLLGRARDFAFAKNNGIINAAVIDGTMALESVDDLGLTMMDRDYLVILADTFSCKPAGANAIAASMNIDRKTVDEVIEPFLLRCGMIVRGSRGRVLTDKGYEYVHGLIRRSK